MTTDRGAAGFCTNHGQAADRSTTVAEAVEVGARAIEKHWITESRNLGQYRTEYECRCGETWTTDGHSSLPQPDFNQHIITAVLEAVGYADLLAEVERLREECIIWLGRAGERLRERDAAEAREAALREALAVIASETEGHGGLALLHSIATGKVGPLAALHPTVMDTPTDGGAR